MRVRIVFRVNGSDAEKTATGIAAMTTPRTRAARPGEREQCDEHDDCERVEGGTGPPDRQRSLADLARPEGYRDEQEPGQGRRGAADGHVEIAPAPGHPGASVGRVVDRGRVLHADREAEAVDRRGVGGTQAVHGVRRDVDEVARRDDRSSSAITIVPSPVITK